MKILIMLLLILSACNADKPANLEKEAADVRIKLTFNNEEIIVKMMNHPTSRDFLDRLPLELSFTDYGGTEKISMLDTKLTNSEAPSGIKVRIEEI